jgi:hypothetical protein
MAHRRPYVFLNYVYTAWDSNRAESHDTKTFPSYREVLKNLKDLLKSDPENIVTVYRHRRGEWGEWFEKWGLLDGKPVKLKEGWM